MQGDDYVIYCHPSKQKNPKASHLREWYHTLLDTAAARGIVTYRSTLADTFLPGGRDHALREPSATFLPYFDGDFWPGEAENQLQELASGKPAACVYPLPCCRPAFAHPGPLSALCDAAC